MERELDILRKVVQELLKIPKVLIERLTKWADFNCILSLFRRGAHLFLFLSELDDSDINDDVKFYPTDLKTPLHSMFSQRIRTCCMGKNNE